MTRENLEELYRKGKLSFKGVINHSNGSGYVRIYKEKNTTRHILKEYDSGYICLSPGSSLGFHWHNIDAEKYLILAGSIESNGIIYSTGESVVCSYGHKHNCRNVSPDNGEAIIYFTKKH